LLPASAEDFGIAVANAEGPSVAHDVAWFDSSRTNLRHSGQAMGSGHAPRGQERFFPEMKSKWASPKSPVNQRFSVAARILLRNYFACQEIGSVSQPSGRNNGW
jgi:hypothetical protein